MKSLRLDNNVEIVIREKVENPNDFIEFVKSNSNDKSIADTLDVVSLLDDDAKSNWILRLPREEQFADAAVQTGVICAVVVVVFTYMVITGYEWENGIRVPIKEERQGRRNEKVCHPR